MGPRIIFFGYSEVGYDCLSLLLERGDNVVALITHEDSPHEKIWFGQGAGHAQGRRNGFDQPWATRGGGGHGHVRRHGLERLWGEADGHRRSQPEIAQYGTPKRIHDPVGVGGIAQAGEPSKAFRVEGAWSANGERAGANQQRVLCAQPAQIWAITREEALGNDLYAVDALGLGLKPSCGGFAAEGNSGQTQRELRIRPASGPPARRGPLAILGGCRFRGRSQQQRHRGRGHSRLTEASEEFAPGGCLRLGGQLVCLRHDSLKYA